ncbi:hypothetical protein M8J77_022104 [Diaphorina citri]|nr:hypothetical protein M8J77_022104 [Diaphorina citri]
MATAKDLSQSVHLLLQLREPPSSLCSEYLSHAELRLSSQLESLTQLDPSVDILEFVQQSGDGYVNDLCLMISCYNDMFINSDMEDTSIATSQLTSFVTTNMGCYLELVNSRLESERSDSGSGDTGVLVRALDRFHRKVQTVSTLFAYTDFTITSQDIIIKASRRQCKTHLDRLKAHFSDALTRLRHSLLSTKLTQSPTDDSGQNTLSTELMPLGVAIVEKVKAVLQDLMSPTDDSGQNTLSTELMPLGVAIVEKVKAVLQDLMSPTNDSGQNTLSTELMPLGVAIVEKVKAVLQDLMSPTDDSGLNTLSTELMPLGVAIVEKVKAVLQDLMVS